MNTPNYTIPVGAGLPAKQTLRCMAPAMPVFAGKPAPTGICDIHKIFATAEVTRHG